jgi:hypothetical protein
VLPSSIASSCRDENKAKDNPQAVHAMTFAWRATFPVSPEIRLRPVRVHPDMNFLGPLKKSSANA